MLFFKIFIFRLKWNEETHTFASLIQWEEKIYEAIEFLTYKHKFKEGNYFHAPADKVDDIVGKVKERKVGFRFWYTR